MKRLALRSKIAGLFATLYGVLFLVLLAWLIFHIQLDYIEYTDRELQRTTDLIIRRLHEAKTKFDSLIESLTQSSDVITPTRYVSIDRDGRSLARSHNYPLDSLFESSMEDDGFDMLHRDGNWYRTYSLSGHGFHIHLVEDITHVEDTILDAVILILISIPFVALISIVTGLYLVRRVLKPIDEIISKAKQISSESLNERIPTPESEDELQRLVETLNDMIGRLEEGFRRMEEFSANASHELRTPLTILKGELEVTLQTERTPEEYRATLMSNLEEVRRIAKTVSSLFLLARMDSKRLQLTIEEIDLTMLLEEIYSEAQVLARPKDIHVQLDVKGPLRLKCDVVLVTQLLLNLLDNAVKYTDREGKVTLSGFVQNGFACVVVKDNGIGIDEEHVRKIFERFYRVDKQRSRMESGAGLGLSIVEWIARMHDGEIRVTSEPGRGSEFTVALPLARNS